MHSLLLDINKYMGVSKAYGRAIGTNFGFSSIAQSPPPEPELPLPERRSGALAREGGKRAKLGKPTLRTSGSSMLIANQQKGNDRGDSQETSRILRRVPQESSTASKLIPRALQIDPRGASKGITLGRKSWRTCSRKAENPEIRPHLDPLHIDLLRSLVLSGPGGGLCAKPTLTYK